MKSFKEILNENIHGDLQSILDEISSFFRKSSSNVRKITSGFSYSKAIGGIESRDWGKWETAEGDEDDGDNDWEVLSNKSSAELKKFVDSLNAKHKNYKFFADTGEKNWITLEVLPK